ncbi:ABC transporter ATP-binding protein [Vagococcus humatus]|uniref:ABC transporter ATP-binding protein n=1 Tax=Vagococcus humatus TaxID=1889241 RepID=A0A3R9YCN3_9ENTE|nr:ABC transporter ATP-binding protein [Vagococcus humatus]RST89332.1 ABC transporter ATP-binding protein [Vagococcus humatus]
MNSFEWIWQYSKKFWKYGVIAIILVIINAATIAINPLLTGKIVDEVIEGGKENLLVPLLLIMIGVTFFRTAVRYCYQLLFERIGQNTLFDLRMDLYQKLQELDFDFFNHTRVGDIMARMTGDTDAIRHFVSWVTYNILEAILWFVIAIIAMGTINMKLMLSLVAVTPIIFILTKKMANESQAAFFEIRESFSRLNSMVEENIGGNRVVKAFAREAYEIEKFNQHNDDFKERNMGAADISKKYLPWLDGLAGSLTLITLLVGGLFVMYGEMTLGELVTFNGFLWMLNMPMRMSGWLVNDVQRFNAASIKIRQMLTTTPSIPVAQSLDQLKIEGHVTFKDVSFHFSDDPTTEVLSHISFSAKPGQTIGILGETGSGKTTLVNLIARFYDASSGEIWIDGKRIEEYPVRQLRENISMVMQDVFLFSNTIQDNIAFGTPEADLGYVSQIAKIADAHGFIASMPEGYQTIVGERGVGLSGGQKQRISLARALAKNPSILILDDTTSAVDMETESKIQQELTKLTGEKTTFIIAHRISSVRDADLILMMSHGKIVERGTHEELIQQQGMYFDVYKKQLGLEEDELKGGAKLG